MRVNNKGKMEFNYTVTTFTEEIPVKKPKVWYQSNAEYIRERNKERYRTDAEYKRDKLRRANSYYHKNKDHIKKKRAENVLAKTNS